MSIQCLYVHIVGSILPPDAHTDVGQDIGKRGVDVGIGFVNEQPRCAEQSGKVGTGSVECLERFAL